jgi:hypothetical protein
MILAQMLALLLPVRGSHAPQLAVAEGGLFNVTNRTIVGLFAQNMTQARATRATAR